jgi:RHH-type proline utilization regulon transcriptional repressor/proline dehydrogenase/delta 1-pyrroline-5-carboxylate dehydrogenase
MLIRSPLAYLVRRLLENGANSSFVHQIVDEEVSPDTIARDPFEAVEAQGTAQNPAIPMPSEIFMPARRNSRGWDVSDFAMLEAIARAFAAPHRWEASPLTQAGGGGQRRDIVNPARTAEIVGSVVEADARQVAGAVERAVAAAGMGGTAGRPAFGDP